MKSNSAPPKTSNDCTSLHQNCTLPKLTPAFPTLYANKNNVGYTTKTTTSGFNWYAPMFTSVGLNTIDIQDIKLTGDDLDYVANIQILDEGGALTTQFIFDGEGWLDDNFAPAEATISFADGILIDTGDDGAGAVCTVAGEVPAENASFVTVAGFNFTGNPFPATIDIQDIKLTGDGLDYVANIQILDEGGSLATQFIFDGEGWLDDNFAPATFALAPGAGILIDTGDDGAGATVTIKVPYTL